MIAFNMDERGRDMRWWFFVAFALATGCHSSGKDNITPEYVADQCDVHISQADPDQDDFCEGKSDCHVSGGASIGCPHACSCVCFHEMTFISSCTLVECPPEQDYSVCY